MVRGATSSKGEIQRIAAKVGENRHHRTRIAATHRNNECAVGLDQDRGGDPRAFESRGHASPFGQSKA